MLSFPKALFLGNNADSFLTCEAEKESSQGLIEPSPSTIC